MKPKEITLKILLTREQKNILEAKAMSYGFRINFPTLLVRNYAQYKF